MIAEKHKFCFSFLFFPVLLTVVRGLTVLTTLTSDHLC